MPPVNPFTAAAKLAAKDIVKGQPGHGVAAALALVDQSPTAPDLLVDLMAAEGRRKRPNQALLAAYTLMFAQGLANWSDGVKRRTATALRSVDALSAKLVAAARSGEISLDALLMLYAQFDAVDIDPGDALSNVVANLASAEDEMEGDVSPPEALVRQLAKVANALNDEFELFEQLATSTAAFSPDQRAAFAALTLVPSEEKLNNAAVGWLLDPMPTVRAVLPTLIQEGAPVSGLMLRRLIMLRNWAPSDDRPALDEAIKRSRKAGVAITPLADATVDDIFASGWDGAGAQSLFIVVKDGRKWTLASILLKMGFGVRDAWVRRGMTKRQLTAMLDDVHDQIGLGPTSLEYVSCAVGHALAVNADLGVPPPFGLLDVAETAGLATLRAETLSLEDLLEQVKPPTDDSTTLQALDNSALWEEIYPFAGSWFEEGEAVDTVMARRRTSSPAAVKAVLSQVLEARRREWAERFAWTALTMKMSTAPANLWQEMAIVAGEVLAGRPLAGIPAMVNIGQLTVEAHLGQRMSMRR